MSSYILNEKTDVITYTCYNLNQTIFVKCAPVVSLPDEIM